MDTMVSVYLRSTAGGHVPEEGKSKNVKKVSGRKNNIADSV